MNSVVRDVEIEEASNLFDISLLDSNGLPFLSSDQNFSAFPSQDFSAFQLKYDEVVETDQMQVDGSENKCSELWEGETSAQVQDRSNSPWSVPTAPLSPKFIQGVFKEGAEDVHVKVNHWQLLQLSDLPLTGKIILSLHRRGNYEMYQITGTRKCEDEDNDDLSSWPFRAVAVDEAKCQRSYDMMGKTRAIVLNLVEENLIRIKFPIISTFLNDSETKMHLKKGLAKKWELQVQMAEGEISKLPIQVVAVPRTVDKATTSKEALDPNLPDSNIQNQVVAELRTVSKKRKASTAKEGPTIKKEAMESNLPDSNIQNQEIGRLNAINLLVPGLLRLPNERFRIVADLVQSLDAL